MTDAEKIRQLREALIELHELMLNVKVEIECPQWPWALVVADQVRKAIEDTKDAT